MLFDSPEHQLEKFTEKYGKRRSIGAIPHGDLENWKKLTQKTEGRYIQKCMAPSLWSDSIESLQTAVAIMVTYTPNSLYSSEEYQKALPALRQRLLKKIKLRYDATHGKLKARP
jgi:hypothetical protein